MTKRVGVIGAGVSGMAAIKSCLDEGMTPVCWEQGEVTGGLWAYSDNVRDGYPSVYNSCVINSSKEMVCYSDFPIPKEFPNFMSHRHFKKYLDMYADHHKLRNYITFGTRVHKVSKAPDFPTSGRWVVTYKDLQTGTVSSDTVDCLMVCNGHLHEPNMPKIKGMETFKGRIMHSREYKTFAGFENKRVLVIGIGNSGSDIASEVSRHAEHVFVSTRNGTIIVQRAGEFGQPFDQGWIRRWYDILPDSLMSPIHYHKVNYKYNHANYGLAPNYRFGAVIPTVSDDLPNRILHGFLSMHPNVSCIKENSVVLEDGKTLENIDIIVMATGFKFSFPFLDNDVIKVDNHYPKLYNLVFPADLQPQTLAVIGLVQPFGSLPPALEMQSRVAARVFTGRCKLPDHGAMMETINKRHAFLKSKHVNSQRYSGLQAYFINYLDTLAEMIGCKPQMWKLFFTRNGLWRKVYFGPATPPQWRLQGPGKWDGAEEAIKSVTEKTYFPMKTREAGKGETDGIYDGWVKLFMYLVVIFVSMVTMKCLF